MVTSMSFGRKVRWLRDRVIVEPFKQTETQGGIIIPDKIEAKMKTGQVIGVGEEVKDIFFGDIVYFLRWVGNPISVNNVDAIYFSAYHIIGLPD